MFHDLGRSAVRNVNRPWRARVRGNADQRTQNAKRVNRYNVVVEADLTEVLERLSKVLRQSFGRIGIVQIQLQQS